MNGTRPAASQRDLFDDPARFDAAFDRAFTLVAFAMNRHLVDHMLRVARRFEIDFETLTLWTVLAHQNTAHLMPPGSMPTAVLTERGRLPEERVPELRPVRLRDLSQITGIPRETARRKLDALARAGWILQTGQGWLVNRDRTDPDLREFSRESARRFLATAADVQRLMRDADRTPAVRADAAGAAPIAPALATVAEGRGARDPATASRTA